MTITSDKGRLSESEIERMVKEAEENAESDRMLKENIEAKNMLESYLYGLKSSVSGDALKGKISVSDRQQIETAVATAQQWLETHPGSSKDEYDAKRKEVETVAAPIVSKAYSAAAATGAPGQQQQAAEEEEEEGSAASSSSSSADAAADSSGAATVEEVD